MKAKQLLPRLRFAMSSRANFSGLMYIAGTVAAGLGTWMLLEDGTPSPVEWLVLALPSLAALGALLLGMGKEYDMVGRNAVRAQASKWADAGQDPDAIRLRYSRIEALGSRAALLEAGVKPIEMTDYNVDGTPMLVGVGADFNGNALGYNMMNLGMPEDGATGMVLDIHTAYQPPMGMDSSNGMSVPSSSSSIGGL